jgi:hypothetical protein
MKKKSKRIFFAFIGGIILLPFLCQELSWAGDEAVDR